MTLPTVIVVSLVLIATGVMTMVFGFVAVYINPWFEADPFWHWLEFTVVAGPVILFLISSVVGPDAERSAEALFGWLRNYDEWKNPDE